MAEFVGIHNMGGPVDQSLVDKGWEIYKDACEKLGIKGVRIDYSTEKGIFHCVTEANTQDEVHKAHEDANKDMMPQDIFEIKTKE